jgi:hypothetical protein
MSKRILVVEDHADNRQIIRDMLAPTDYEITEAENGEEALAAIAKQRPDLILMDIQLPIMDGYAAARRIKADPALRTIPIIQSPPMRSTEKSGLRGRLAAMTMCQNLSAHANCLRKFVSICNSCSSGFRLPDGQWRLAAAGSCGRDRRWSASRRSRRQADDRGAVRSALCSRQCPRLC